MTNLPCISFLLLLSALTTTHAIGPRPENYVDPAYEDINDSPPAAPAGPLSSAKQELLNKACGASPQYKDLCISTLQSYPEATIKDLPDLATYAVKKVANEANDTMYNIEALDDKTQESSDNLKLKLVDCSDIYGDIADSFRESADMMAQKNYPGVIAAITGAMNDVESCEEGFKVPPVAKSPLTAVNDKFSQLCDICLAITSAIGK
ncbi:Pectinesterase inhibitor [Linum perenne]